MLCAGFDPLQVAKQLKAEGNLVHSPGGLTSIASVFQLVTSTSLPVRERVTLTSPLSPKPRPDFPTLL